MRVAVVLTCHEEGAFIEEALASVLAQTAGGEIAEIVLADDGSGPQTARVLDALEDRDPRLRLLRGRPHPAGARHLRPADRLSRWRRRLDAGHAGATARRPERRSGAGSRLYGLRGNEGGREAG